MPEFIWIGKTRSGDKIRGKLEADDAKTIRRILERQGVKVLKVKPAPKHIAEYLPFLAPKVKLPDMVIFARQFATLINAGVPIVQTLDILREQTDNFTFKKALLNVREAVKAGDSLSDAMKKNPKVFDELMVNLIGAGEAGGALDVIMNRLADYLEKVVMIRRKIKSAMLYPIVISVFAVVVVMVLLIYVVPIFKRMFEEAGMSLPLPTQVVVSISNWLRNYFHLFIIFLILFGFLLRWFKKTERGRLLIDKALLSLPVFGLLLKKAAVARMCRTLGTLVENGVPILDALTISAGTVGNRVLEKALYYTREEVSRGRGVSDPMEETHVFPVMVPRMIKVGENTGAVDEMLNKIADFFEDEVDRTVEALTSLIEPIFIVFLGVVVGGILISMYLPIFQLGQTIG